MGLGTVDDFVAVKASRIYRVQQLSIGCGFRDVESKGLPGRRIRSSTWSRTRFRTLLKSVEYCGFQVTAVEPVAGRSLNDMELS
jgi:hypothetical protein